jgi:hypothetical protein
MNYDNGGVAGRRSRRAKPIYALPFSGPDKSFELYQETYQDDENISGRKKKRKGMLEKSLEEQTGYDVTEFEDTPIIPMAKPEPKKLDDNTSTTGTLPGGEVSYDTNVGGTGTETGTGTGTGTGTVTTEFTTPPEVKPEPTVPESDPYEYNKDLMNRYLAEVFKEDTGGVDIGKTAAALGMIQGIGGSREDIAAAQKSAQDLAAIEMGREKARRDDMAKALSMGMSAEQFEKKFGIEKPYYEARTEAKLAEADYLSSFGKEKAERFKMRQKFVTEALEKAPGVRQIDLKLQRIDLSEKERRDLEIKKEQLITDYVNRRMSSVFETTSNLANIAPSAFTSKTGVPIIFQPPGQTGTE